MYRVIFTLALIQCCLNSFGQKTIYYDKYFSSVSEEKTPYTRTFEDAGPVVKFTEMSYDTISATGYIKAGKHADKVNEMAAFVRYHGNSYYFKEEFNAMRCEVDYFEKGVHCSKIISHTGKVRFAQLYSEDGKELLVNGSGQNIRPKNGVTTHEYYTDS